MKNKLVIFIIVSIFFLLGFKNNEKRAESFGQKYLLKADELYNDGNREDAKELYLEASNTGNVEAHFKIAYYYLNSPEESIYHLSEAAMKGHEKALVYVLDELLFMANNLKLADPKGALDIYSKAKKANPDIKIYNEKDMLKTLKMCAEPKKFNAEKFIKKYEIKDINDNYGIWELAEEASRKGGRFGDPNPELVFNLIIRGSSVPAELKSAVEEGYHNWKKNIVKEFNISDHIFSGNGMTYLALRSAKVDKKNRELTLNKLESNENKEFSRLLRSAYSSAVEFFEAKVENEEIYGGTSRISNIIFSETDKKNKYIKSIEKIYDGFTPSIKNNFDKIDQQLNKVYKKVKTNKIKEVQRLWIPYRDNSVKLFMYINPDIEENIWETWLTEERINQLESIDENVY